MRDPEEVGLMPVKEWTWSARVRARRQRAKPSVFHIAVVLCLRVVTIGKHMFPKLLGTETLLSS